MLPQERRERSTEIRTPHAEAKSSDEVQATRVIAALLNRDVLVVTHSSTTESYDPRRRSGRSIHASDGCARGATCDYLDVSDRSRPAVATDASISVSTMAIDPDDGDAA